jgi:hypothetical protein
MFKFQTNLDECINSPCVNGGVCKDGVNEYKCMCRIGWSGDRCTEEHDACISSPCVHGTCRDKMQGYVCL